METSYIPAIPVILDLDPPKTLGILPFVTKPEIIVWDNRVFLPANTDPQDNHYKETDFGLADQPDDHTIVRLEVRTGQFVASVRVPTQMPGVIRWGERIFFRKGSVYCEGFFAIAHELAIPQSSFETMLVKLQRSVVGLREAVEDLECDVKGSPLDFEEVNSSFDEVAEYFKQVRSHLKNDLYTLPGDKT
ncbi:hypothetical protein [Nostoc sp. ChiVER01]|uniref:hypothetical protein n=1 Tax=Nostoc sp. ChiVER01 TaxID=3075382 RepID=UPI002AD3B326|nr:hypothetical protein [Nostoc sp. ChiVER01]MDZ8227560.1 hypothetical protein [Nostoc sp. ChiVER01]